MWQEREAGNFAKIIKTLSFLFRPLEALEVLNENYALQVKEEFVPYLPTEGSKTSLEATAWLLEIRH